MDFNKILEDKKISKYKLSKMSGVPYSTICDISTGKSDIYKCSAETVIRLGHVLGMTAEEIIGDIQYPEITPSKKKSKSAEKDADKTKEPKKKTTAKKKETEKSSSKKKDSEKGSAERSNTKAGSAASARRSITNISSDIAARNAAKEKAYQNYCKNLMEQKDTMGELNFLVTYLKNNEVVILYNLNRKRESRFLLSLLDDLCVKNNFPICKEYEEIRNEEDDI